MEDISTISQLSYWYNLIETYSFLWLRWLWENYRDFALVVQVAALSLIVSFCLMAITQFDIFRNVWKKRKWKKVEKKLRERYGEGIAYVLSPEADDHMGRSAVMKALELDENTHDPKSVLKDDREKLSMARIIYRARIADEADIAATRNLHVLLNLFSLREYLEEVIIKDPLHLKVEALHMLRAFKVPTNQWIANLLVNSKKRRVRRLAMYASIMSSTNTDLEYFESEFFNNNFCVYDEIQLGFILQRRISANRKIPNLAHWAHLQQHPETQAMFMRLMRQFNQKEYCNELEEFFQHDSDAELIEEIARTWGYLKYNEGEELMKDMLLTQPDDGKVAIMHAITRINSGESLQTLVDVYRNTGSQHVKFEALRCIYLYGDKGRTKFEELRQQMLPGEEKLFAFFTNELTRHEIELEASDRYQSQFGENLYTVV